MRLKILCSGYLIRYPVGGMYWHHLQYLIGLRRLGHEVVYFENFGWPNSCFEPILQEWSSDPTYGIGYFLKVLRFYEERVPSWSYLSENGQVYGSTRSQLAEACKNCDLYLDMSYMNWIPEVENCRRRALIDTDPVFLQIGGHGAGGPFSEYHALFTYGENVHRPGCTMPDAGMRWIPTRQPIVIDLWPLTPGNPEAPFTTVMNWSAYGDRSFGGKIYGQKDRQFGPYFEFPLHNIARMELALNCPTEIRKRLLSGGWNLTDPKPISATPASYQAYLAGSKAEFSVAKHAYVSTQSGWFSDRSAAYIASGRPVLIEDTGFTRWLRTEAGVVPFRSYDEAAMGMIDINRRYREHCNAAREIACEYFDSRKVLTLLIENATASPGRSQHGSTEP